MESMLVLGLLSVVLSSAGVPLANDSVKLSNAEDIDANTELHLAFVVCSMG